MFTNRTPHHSARRSLRKRIRLTLTIVGLLLIILGLLLAASGLLQKGEEPREVFLRWALGYLLGGAVLLAVRWLVFSLPKQRQRSHRNPHSKTGASLVVVLGLLAVLGILLYQAHALHAASRLRLEREATALHLRAVLQDAGRDALQRLAEDPDWLYDSSNDVWATAREWVDPSGVGIRIRIDDDNRRFDLNNLAVRTTGTLRAPGDVLLDLLVQCGEFSSGDRVRALLDWVDADDEGFRERSFYRETEQSRLPANRVLQSRGELYAVAGWSPDLFAPAPPAAREALFEAHPADCLTVLPRPRERIIPVNLNTANRAVLTGLFGLEHETAVNRILTFRDETRIADLDQLVGLVSPDVLEPVRAYLAVHSTWYRIEAAAFRDGVTARMSWLVEREREGGLRVHSALL